MIRVTLFDFLMLFNQKNRVILALYPSQKPLIIGHNFREIINQYLSIAELKIGKRMISNSYNTNRLIPLLSAN